MRPESMLRAQVLDAGLNPIHESGSPFLHVWGKIGGIFNSNKTKKLNITTKISYKLNPTLSAKA